MEDLLSRNGKFRQKSSENAVPIGSLILDLPPSCLEFVPYSSETTWAIEEPMFVIGTYDLQKEDQAPGDDDQDEEIATVPKEQSRQGSLSLFSLGQDRNTLVKHTWLHTPSALLDLHFLPTTPYFATCSSTGTISIYRISSDANQSQRTLSIIPVTTHQILAEDEIITSFAWDPTCSWKRPMIAITSTTGAVMVVGFSEDFKEWEFVKDEEELGKHGFEAWCCAWSGRGEVLYSGGDDSKLILSPVAPSSLHSSPRKLPFHNAGVTAILPVPSPNPSQEDTTILLTGSYDDFIRIYQLPSSTTPKPKVLAEKDIGLSGGGVWRLKFLKPPDSVQEEEKYTVLATCMRDGCKIVEITRKGAVGEEDEWRIEVLANTGVHESMNYASDFAPLGDGERGKTEKGEGWTIVSSSFYDRLVFVWRYEPDEIAKTL